MKTNHSRFQQILTLSLSRWLVAGIGLVWLLAALPAAAGPIIIGGDDLDDHGSYSAGVNTTGWLYIQNALSTMTNGCITRCGNDGSIAALGCTDSTVTGGGNGGAAIHYAAVALSPPRTVSYYTGSALSAFFDNLGACGGPAILYVPTPSSNIGNGISSADIAVLAANAGKIRSFVNSGGGLMAHISDSASSTWLATVLPGIMVVNLCDVNSAILTPAGLAAFPGLTVADIRAGPCHATFTGNLNNLNVLALDSTNRNLIIGGGCGATIICTNGLSLTCVSNKTVVCGTNWMFDAPQATNVCCGTNITTAILSTQTNGNCPQVVTRTWRVVDCLGNSNICTQTVTVLATTAPVFTNCPASTNLGCNPANIPDCTTNVGATNSCAMLAPAYLLVSSSGSSEVKRYDATTGVFLNNFISGGPLNSPRGMVIGPDGNLYVCSQNTHSVLRYNATTGTFMDTFASGGGLNQPFSLTFGPDGNLYVSGGSVVKRYNGTTGAFMGDFSTGFNLYHLTFGPDGNLYASSYANSSVTRFSGVTGAFIDTFVSSGSGGLSGAYGLVFGPDGSLYVCSSGSAEIKRYNGTTGAFMGTFAAGGGLSNPDALLFGPDGNLYVASFSNSQVLRYHGTTGAFIDNFTSGSALSGASGLVFTYSTQQVPVACAKVDTTNGCSRTRTITYTAMSSCGVTNNCVQVVTWKVDTTPPVITCVSNKSVNCGEPWAFDPPAAVDGCTGSNIVVMVVSTVTNGPPPLVVTRIWKATDACGNTNSCSQQVTLLTNCCLTVSGETITATTNCTYTYKFTVRNDTAQVVSYVSMTATNGSYVFSQPLTYLNPPLQPGQSRQLTQTITGAACSQICFYIGLHTATLAECCSRLRCVTLPACCNQSITYSTAAQFTNNGALMNLIYTNGALRFPPHTQPFPYVYIACSGRGTIVKIDINSGAVLGEYYTSPAGNGSDYPYHHYDDPAAKLGPNPSRTTVDLRGNVWVANRTANSASKATVTRIALLIGGTRVNADKTPNPNGQYLMPPFAYNSGAVDRDGDGLIKTSRALGIILNWSGLEPVNGSASTAEDECIINYTVVSAIVGGGIRTIAVDRDNNVWVGASLVGGANGEHQKINGSTGLPVSGTLFAGPGQAGGYGGLIDGNNVLWSARGANTDLLRVDLNTVGSGGGPFGQNLGHTQGNYGLSIDPCNGNIWHTVVTGNKVYVRAPNGTVLNPGGYDELNPNDTMPPSKITAQGVAVDESGNVWIAHAIKNDANTVGHLIANTGSGAGVVDLRYVGGLIPPGNQGPHGPTGVAVDSNGKIWVSCFDSSRAMRIDPKLGPLVVGNIHRGEVDMVVDLNAAGGVSATPYNYSDKTGYIAVGVTAPSGFWDFVQQSCGPGTEWGTVSWTACTNTDVKAEVRAADKVTDLASKPWRKVSNGVSFCGGYFSSPYSVYPTKITGQFLEVRVTLKRGTTSACQPSMACLQSLTVKCCQSGPVVDWSSGGPTLVTNHFTLVTNKPVVVTWDGGPLVLTWNTNGGLAQNDILPGSPVSTNATVNFVSAYPPGSNSVQLVVSGSDFDPITLESYVIVGDIEPPVWSGPAAIATNAFSGTLPNLISGLTTNELSDDWTLFPDILKLQDIPAGTVVTQSFQMIKLTATDQASNTSTNPIPFSLSPVLSITSPKQYAAFLTTTGMPVTVQIAGNVTGVVQVRYYLNGSLVATSSTPPYGVSLTNLMAGAYSLQAEAVSAAGLTSITPPVLVSISPPESASLQVSTGGGGGLNLSWPAGGWILQSAPQVTGPWTNVPDASSPYPISTTNAQMFYRLVQ